MILHNANGEKTDRTRKYIIKVMKDRGFQTEIETNLKEVNFLDVTFNLNSGLYKRYKKPNDQLLYDRTSSDLPPQIIKQLPNSINRKPIEIHRIKQSSIKVKMNMRRSFSKVAIKLSLNSRKK